MLFASPLIMIGVFPIDAALSRLGLSGSLGHGIIFEGFGLVECLYIGILIGWVAGKMIPSLISTGVWVAALPTVVILSSIFSSRLSCSFSGLIFATGGNEAADLVHQPTHLRDDRLFERYVSCIKGTEKTRRIEWRETFDAVTAAAAQLDALLAAGGFEEEGLVKDFKELRQRARRART